MFQLRKPTADDIHHYLLTQRSEGFSYSEVGDSLREECSNRFRWDVHGVELGRGEMAFESAREAIRRWGMMPRPMTSVYWPVEPKVGAEVLVGFNLGPLRTLNPCRVVYLVDDEVAGMRRFGFGYGTLPGHAECGEERFMVTHDLSTGLVRYEVCSFSRPQHWLVRMALPLARFLQSRFRRRSGEQMQRIVREELSEKPARTETVKTSGVVPESPAKIRQRAAAR